MTIVNLLDIEVPDAANERPHGFRRVELPLGAGESRVLQVGPVDVVITDRRLVVVVERDRRVSLAFIVDTRCRPSQRLISVNSRNFRNALPGQWQLQQLFLGHVAHS